MWKKSCILNIVSLFLFRYKGRRSCRGVLRDCGWDVVAKVFRWNAQ